MMCLSSLGPTDTLRSLQLPPRTIFSSLCAHDLGPMGFRSCLGRITQPIAHPLLDVSREIRYTIWALVTWKAPSNPHVFNQAIFAALEMDEIV